MADKKDDIIGAYEDSAKATKEQMVEMFREYRANRLRPALAQKLNAEQRVADYLSMNADDWDELLERTSMQYLKMSFDDAAAKNQWPREPFDMVHLREKDIDRINEKKMGLNGNEPLQ